jgi:Flp pilus assembly protein TadD
MDRIKANFSDAADETNRIIAEELKQLLDSPMFGRSPVLSRLLQFLADHRLRGGRSAPKAYAIATEALGRSADFDPAIDSYPRVMVGRLRSQLDRYYAETPWVHRLRVPQGSYEIVVQHRVSPPAAAARSDEPTGEDAAAPLDAPSIDPGSAGGGRAPRFLLDWRGGWHWIALGGALALLLLAGWWRFGGQAVLLGNAAVPIPLVEISPPLAGDTAPSRALARALDGRLRDGMRRFGLIDILSANAPGSAEAGRRADYRLDTSLVRSDPGVVDVTLVLNRVADQRAIWSDHVRLANGDVPEFHGIEPLIAQISGDYGIIVRDQVQREPDNFTPGYPCLAQFHRLRQARRIGTADQVDKCLRASLKQTPRDPVLLNALSLLRFSDWQPMRGRADGKAAFVEAQALARRAYDSGPNSSAGLFAMARNHFYTGDCTGGNAMGEAAAKLNPYDSALAGFLGLFQVSCGQMVEGEAMLRRSIALDDSDAGVPAVTLAFIMTQRGELEDALAILNRMPSPSNLEPQYMMVRAIIVARQGDVDAGRRLWQRLLTYTGQPSNAAPETVLRRFMISPTVIGRAAAALRESGVTPGKSVG